MLYSVEASAVYAYIATHTHTQGVVGKLIITRLAHSVETSTLRPAISNNKIYVTRSKI